jgi:hypothetical protein
MILVDFLLEKTAHSKEFCMTNYTDEQKNIIMQMPAAVLLGSIVADPGSAIVGMREFIAGEKFITDASQQYPRNTLIHDMLSSLNLPKLEEAVKPVLSMGNLDSVRAECNNKVSTGQSVLENDEEANQFKSFLVTLSEKVTSAVGEGFFGNRGEKVSQNEAAFVERLRQQLHVAPSSSS